MEAQKLNIALLDAFPELKQEFDEYTSWQDGIDTGAFLTYEDVFLPRIIEAVKNDDAEFLHRVAPFLEQHLTQEGDYSANVIYVGILEGLKAECNHEKVRAFLLDESSRQFDEMNY